MEPVENVRPELYGGAVRLVKVAMRAERDPDMTLDRCGDWFRDSAGMVIAGLRGLRERTNSARNAAQA
jgi:hypothetical protein